MSKSVYTADSGGERLDVYLSKVTGKTRSQIDKLNGGGFVLINGKSEKSGKILKAGDVLEVTLNEAPVLTQPQELPLDVIYEDDSIAVINKAQGMSVHPGAGNKSGTLVNALLYRFGTLSGIGGDRPGIVHRLDKDTSGVIIVAKNDEAHLCISRQIANREVKKIYLGLCEGNIKDDSGEIRTFIGRSPRDRKKMAVLPCGKEAVTLYRVVERFKNNCLVEFNIKTGRTHQIRVHAKYLGHPITGDKTYGYVKQRFDLKGQLLHAYKITFRHPVTNIELTFTAPLPDYFENVLNKLKKEESL